MTNKKLNIVLAGVLCSVGVMAQESTPVIDQKKDVVELGRNVSNIKTYDSTLSFYNGYNVSIAFIIMQ